MITAILQSLDDYIDPNEQRKQCKRFGFEWDVHWSKFRVKRL